MFHVIIKSGTWFSDFNSHSNVVSKLKHVTSSFVILTPHVIGFFFHFYKNFPIYFFWVHSWILSPPFPSFLRAAPFFPPPLPSRFPSLRPYPTLTPHVNSFFFNFYNNSPIYFSGYISGYSSLPRASPLLPSPPSLLLFSCLG